LARHIDAASFSQGQPRGIISLLMTGLRVY
jgi:hypothetical protein